MTEKKAFKLYGMHWYVTVAAVALILLAAATGALGSDGPSILALMLAIGIPFYEIGERIPFWNTFIGGGIILAFIGTAVLVWKNLIPEKYLEGIQMVMDDFNFLNIFIIVLITGSILSLDRKVLLKSFVGYVPAILGGVACAIAFGIVGGLLFGVNPGRVITHYVLPIMGGGNGGGAVPLSEMFEKVTGQDKKIFYNFAIIILTIGNIYAILTGAVLNVIGRFKKGWTGDKKTLMRNTEMSGDLKEAKAEEKITVRDTGAAFLVAVGAYAFGSWFAGAVLPKIAGFPIHKLAYMILFVVILSATGVIPESVRLGAKRLQTFFTKNFTLVIMVGVGIDLDIPEFLAAISSLSNIIIPLFVVVGAIVGSALVGWLVGFYPIDSAVTAGLCMANRGGSGDLAVLGASDRMDLMAYAQLSSRLGGAIILFMGSILFSILL